MSATDVGTSAASVTPATTDHPAPDHAAPQANATAGATASDIDDRRVCVIDLEPFRPGEQALRLPCMHMFHRSCILDYLRQDPEPCCPIDGVPVAKDDVPHLPVWRIPSETASPSSAVLADEQSLGAAFTIPHSSGLGVAAALESVSVAGRALSMRARTMSQTHAQPAHVPSGGTSDELLADALHFRETQRLVVSWPLRPGGICVVDLCPLRAGEGATQLPCGHFFHSACLLPYFRDSNSHRCPVDGYIVSSALSSVRFCTVRDGVTPRAPAALAARAAAPHRLDALHGLCAALAKAEAGASDEVMRQIFRIRERGIGARRQVAAAAVTGAANLASSSADEEEGPLPSSERVAARYRAARRHAARRRGGFARAVLEDELPVPDAYLLVEHGPTVCHGHDGEVEDGTQMTTLQCGHEFCADCAAHTFHQGPSLVRCPRDGALLTRDERTGTRWTAPRNVTEINAAAAAKLGCAELAMANVERKLVGQSVDQIEEILRAGLKERFRLLPGRPRDDEEFDALEVALRELAIQISSDSDSDPVDTATAPAEQPTSTDYSPPSPGDSPTEDLATGLAALFLNRPPFPNPERASIEQDSDPASPDDVTSVGDASLGNDVADVSAADGQEQSAAVLRAIEMPVDAGGAGMRRRHSESEVSATSGHRSTGTSPGVIRTRTWAGMDSPASVEQMASGDVSWNASSRGGRRVQLPENESQTAETQHFGQTRTVEVSGLNGTSADIHRELALQRLRQDAWGGAPMNEVPMSQPVEILRSNVQGMGSDIVAPRPSMQIQSRPTEQMRTSWGPPVYTPRHPVQEARECGPRQGLMQVEDLVAGRQEEAMQTQAAPLQSGTPTTVQDPVVERDVPASNSTAAEEGGPSVTGTGDAENESGGGQGQDSETDDGRVCVIDLEPFRSGEVLIRLPCMHVFHRDCILPFLKRTASPKCPFDRAPVNRAQIDELPVWTKK